MAIIGGGGAQKGWRNGFALNKMDCHGGLASVGQSGGEADAARPLLLPGPSANNDQMVLRNPTSSEREMTLPSRHQQQEKNF